MEKFSSVQQQPQQGKKPKRLISLLSYLTSKKRKDFCALGISFVMVLFAFFLIQWKITIKVEQFIFETFGLTNQLT